MPNIHILNDSAVSNLKLKAKKLSKTESTSISSALNKIACSIGFSDWKSVLDTAKFEASDDLRLILSNTDSNLFAELNEQIRLGNLKKSIIKSKFSPLIIDQYTDLQKIGAISRSQGINPKHIKNTIHIKFAEQQETIDISNADWESWGFFRDYELSKWLHTNDPFFEDAEFALIFRMLSFDSASYDEINEFFFSVHQATGLIYPLAIEYIWINGKIDPDSIESITEEIKEYFPNTDIAQGDVPISQLPANAWKRAY